MLGLSAVVAIAATVAAIFIVFSGVGIVVWVRVRKERHALRVLGLRQGQGSRGLPFTGNTMTELSHAEGTALRAHGFLPYGKPTEWGQLASRESLLRSKNGSESSWPLMDKARSLRHSISRSRSKRLSRSSHKHSRMGSMGTVSEMMPSPPRRTESKEEVPLSAVEGVLELPAERTPRQTPELNREEDGFHLGMRPISPAWPLPSQKDRSALLPVIEDRNSQDMFDPSPRVYEESPRRLRGASIASQTAGLVPDNPIPPPPPPAAYPPDRFSYMRNDSIMRLSSMSLDTTNSSILDDGRNGPRSADTELTSPIFPSGGTFVPFSANDVGVKNGRRGFIAASTSDQLSNFPARSSSTAEARRRSSMEPLSPRRSMTTTSRNPSNASDHFAPHRSGSVSSNAQRHASLRSGTPISMSPFENSTTSNWPSGHPMAYVPHFSQFQQPLVYEEPREYDPFYGGSPRSSGTLFSMGSPGQAPSSFVPASPMQRSSLSQRGGPLQSAMKSSGSHRKGHRRQNCVRISIHPPMSFGGPKFTPTVEEEPEDFDTMEEVDLRESAVNCPPKPQLAFQQDTTSSVPLSKRSSSRRARAEPSSLGPLAEEPQSTHNRTPSKKRKKAPGDTSNPLFSKDRNLPGITTSLPPATTANLSHTPSPEHITPVWTIPEAPSPTYENCSVTGSPRRSGVKGPRSQPTQAPRAARSNSEHTSPPKMEPLMGAGSPSGLPLITGTQGSDWRKSTDSLHRTNTDVNDRSYRRFRESQGSLSGGVGTSVASPSPMHGTRARSSTVKDRVTIWEDANRSGSPPKPSAVHLGLPENTSPVQNKNSIPRALEKIEQSPSPSRVTPLPPTPNSARRGLVTPTGKALGLGIGCTTTPASLYDGDGFLRE
ncbi:hypothetical protein N7492_000149 [Penicillium capsulatum]|uniref:Uncharacterized protein n=1 Tax=Penicillium capsulatum TaxID=69766 RepID=A0A9W9INZ2_9EURO|nr:hypothetical protein N7492_000149 [Penicillium capsulatum]KAJ6130786.1 hypothetical protein N7512_003566 [Penicillium capsulatum]